MSSVQMRLESRCSILKNICGIFCMTNGWLIASYRTEGKEAFDLLVRTMAVAGKKRTRG